MSISLAPFCKMASASAYTSMYFHSLGGSIKLLYHIPDGIYNLLQLHCSRGAVLPQTQSRIDCVAGYHIVIANIASYGAGTSSRALNK